MTFVSENRSQGNCSTKKRQKWGSFVGRGAAGGTSKEKNVSWAVQAEGRTFSKKIFGSPSRATWEKING